MSPVYLDSAASTALDPQVLAAMVDLLGGPAGCANPSATSHAYGQAAAGLVADARAAVAAGFHCEPREVVFTSGATEAINLALQGIAHGGGQEFGLRPGTLAPHQNVGLATALTLAATRRAAELAPVSALKARFLDQLRARLPVRVHGDQAHASPYIKSPRATRPFLPPVALHFALAECFVAAAQPALPERDLQGGEADHAAPGRCSDSAMRA